MAAASSSSSSFSSSSSSSSCAAVPRWDYDVFLSFRGEDTRAGFVSHLHSALRRGGARVFIDDELRRGERISLTLERAIESSRIAIVVFSPTFADSPWCLQELTKTLEMQDSKGQLVRPVFYHVDPSDVRKQTGDFAEIMARHEEVLGGDGSERVKKWRDALRQAANLSGWHLDKGKFSKAQLIHASNNFSDDNKIGVGSAGSVYYGILDGREVAIKWTYVTKKGFEDGAFMAEIQTLCHVNHKNLVRMLGFHATRNEHALVREYMNNGWLFCHLHTFESSALISWTTRLKVALDVARGMEYLHEFTRPQIVHGDVKSANILLDKSWTAKIVDFGFSVHLPEDEESDHRQFVGGTMGYLAPEYISSNRPTTKTHVYGYGIVLLELLSGRKAFQRDEDGPLCHITEVVVPNIIEGKICQSLDPRLPVPAHFEMKAVADMAYLAVDCVHMQAENRPL